MKKIILFIILPLVCLSSLNAQENHSRWLIMGVPQYLAMNGIRIDIEKQSMSKNTSWVLAPQYYINVGGVGDLYPHTYKKMHGIGLNIYRKMYLTHKNEGIYIGAGLGYQHFDFELKDKIWVEYLNNGLKYMEIRDEDFHVRINKAMFDCLIGYQQEFFQRMHIDTYLGFGLRYSGYDQPFGANIKFNTGALDYGFTGTLFVAGIKIGVDF